MPGQGLCMLWLCDCKFLKTQLLIILLIRDGVNSNWSWWAHRYTGNWACLGLSDGTGGTEEAQQLSENLSQENIRNSTWKNILAIHIHKLDKRRRKEFWPSKKCEERIRKQRDSNLSVCVYVCMLNMHIMCMYVYTHTHTHTQICHTTILNHQVQVFCYLIQYLIRDGYSPMRSNMDINPYINVVSRLHSSLLFSYKIYLYGPIFFFYIVIILLKFSVLWCWKVCIIRLQMWLFFNWNFLLLFASKPLKKQII